MDFDKRIKGIRAARRRMNEATDPEGKELYDLNMVNDIMATIISTELQAKRLHREVDKSEIRNLVKRLNKINPEWQGHPFDV